jgi:hypothetical protein
LVSKIVTLPLSTFIIQLPDAIQLAVDVFMIEFILPFAMNPMVVVCCCDGGGVVVAVGSLLGWAVMLAGNVAFGSWDDGIGNVELLGFEGSVELGSWDGDIINCLGNVAFGCCEVFGDAELSSWGLTALDFGPVEPFAEFDSGWLVVVFVVFVLPFAGAWGNNLVNALTTSPDDKNRFDVNIIPIIKIMDVIIDSNDLVGTSYQPTLYSAVFATTNILEKNYIKF